MFARAGVSGFIYDFEIYVGKGTVTTSELGISGDVVIRLAECLPKGRNFKLFFDNWFTSFRLICALKEVGILSVGTVRHNRLPKCSFKNDNELKREGRGSCDYRTDTKNNVFAIRWYDNKSIHLVSSYKGKEPTDVVKRWSASDKAYIDVQRPAIVKEYNSFMGGVNLHDMLVALYRTNIGVKRGYLKIVYQIIDMCIVNAWLLYRRHCLQLSQTKYKTLVEFRAEVGHALLRNNKTADRKRGRPSLDTLEEVIPAKKKSHAARPVDDVRYDNVGHWPEHIENKQRCKHCIKAYSRIQCDKCKVHLCLNKNNNCFKLFHSR